MLHHWAQCLADSLVRLAVAARTSQPCLCLPRQSERGAAVPPATCLAEHAKPITQPCLATVKSHENEPPGQPWGTKSPRKCGVNWPEPWVGLWASCVWESFRPLAALSAFLLPCPLSESPPSLWAKGREEKQVIRLGGTCGEASGQLPPEDKASRCF